MIVDVGKLVSMARVVMGYSPGDSRLIHCRDPGTLSLDQLLAAQVDRAVRGVYAGLDTVRAAAAARSFDSCGVFWHNPVRGFHSGHVILPPDFGRLVTFRMSDWRMPVGSAIDSGSPAYAVTGSSFPGICGSPWRPVCALAPLADGLALEFHSCASADCVIAEAAYLPCPRVGEDGCVDIERGLIPEIVEAMASMTSYISTNQSR